MTDAQREHLEKRLLQERTKTAEALDRYEERTRTSTEDDGELTQYTQHPADDGTDTMEQEKQMLMLSKETELLGDIDEALRRLYKEPETFGVCSNCGRALDLERLDLVPWALLCQDCQSRAESSS